MLDAIPNTQTIADLFKSVVLDADDAPKDARLDVLRTISRFEQFGWHYQVMAQAIAETAPETDIKPDGVQIEGSSDERLETINAILARYIELYGYDERQNQKLFTMQEAADYLGISKSMMETYVIRRGDIEGERIGRAWVFTQAALDRFKKQRRSRGRPPAET